MNEAINDDESMDSVSTKSLAESTKKITVMHNSEIIIEENSKGSIIEDKNKPSSLRMAEERLKTHKGFMTAATMKTQRYSDIIRYNDTMEGKK